MLLELDVCVLFEYKFAGETLLVDTLENSYNQTSVCSHVFSGQQEVRNFRVGIVLCSKLGPVSQFLRGLWKIGWEQV